MIPQSCHSCHKTDMTFSSSCDEQKCPNFTELGKRGHTVSSYKSENLPGFVSLRSAGDTMRLICFSQMSTKTIFPCIYRGDLSDCDSGFNLSTTVRPCASKTYEIEACWAAAELLNRCLEAICERCLINGFQIKWEMKRCLLEAHEKETLLVGVLFRFPFLTSIIRTWHTWKRKAVIG